VKRALVTTVVIGLMAGMAAADGTPQAAPWPEQLRLMRYFIMNLSSINAINGINLTREQAIQLRAMAKEIEAVAPAAPNVNAGLRPDFAEVRDTYLEDRKLLLAGQDVPESIEKKVHQARTIESYVLRLSGSCPKPSAADCLRCHGEPSAADVRSLPDSKAVLAKDPVARGTGAEQFQAHEVCLLGKAGMALVHKYASRVDGIMTAEQKDVIGSFTCCLTPPKSMSDPVRAGQAQGGEQETKTLRWVRSVPASTWPTSKAWLLEKYRSALVMKAAGTTEAEKEHVAAKVSAVCEKARGLSDTDFELQKDQLAGDLYATVHDSNKNAPDNYRLFMVARFLIGSGTVEAYDRLIQRLDTQKVAKK